MIERLRQMFGFTSRRPLQHQRQPTLCFGREQLCDEIETSVFSHGCVLLFGGRQSGKTTTLRRVADRLNSSRVGLSEGTLTIPVFMDLMRLPHDARPAEFFLELARLSADTCSAIAPSADRARRTVDRVNGLVSFEAAIDGLRSAVPKADLRFLYLLDESKRVIGQRFPRGFHDNLFHLLFGSPTIHGVCSIVFAGAQELYTLCEDDTSPIGSRAAKHCITNLDLTAVQAMAQAIIGSDRPDLALSLAAEVYSVTGGHAGLSAGLLKRLREGGIEETVHADTVVSRFRQERSELFQIWVNSLTKEARLIHDALLSKSTLEYDEMIQLLRKEQLAVHRCDRVMDELQYVGIARRDGRTLISCNLVYSEVAQNFAVPPLATEREREVWPLIEQAEKGLRRLVRRRFDARWAGRADENIRAVIGNDAWAKVGENQAKHIASYPRTTHRAVKTDILDFTYLGQLGQMMMWNKSWDLFKHLFRDKRELEDILRDITPVRNDGAHFRTVPDTELDRCRIRCADLVNIIEREEQAAQRNVD